MALLTGALSGFTEIDSTSFVADTELRLAELAAARGRWPEAEREAARLLAAAEERGAGATETVPLVRIRAGAAAAAGDPETAAELLHQARRATEEAGIRYQRAMTLLELSALEPDGGHREVAVELFEALGVSLEQLTATGSTS